MDIPAHLQLSLYPLEVQGIILQEVEHLYKTSQAFLAHFAVLRLKPTYQRAVECARPYPRWTTRRGFSAQSGTACGFESVPTMSIRPFVLAPIYKV